MESLIFLIGAVIFLVANLFNMSNEINRTNKKIDKIMKALNIGEYEDYSILDNELRNAISEKGKVKAIKMYREITGEGLKEAKEYIDKLTEKNNLE